MQDGPRSPLQVIQAVSGTFHHFDLARELDSYGYLKRIYSTFPWMRLKREDVPRAKIRTFPWIHAPLMGIGRYVPVPSSLSRSLNRVNAQLFESWVASQIEECDVFVGISGIGLKPGRVAQARGGKYVCDRGSSHIRFQARILKEEHARWGLNDQPVHPTSISREEAEYAQADAITVPSEFARRSFIEMGIEPAKVFKIPYGVRLDRFQKTSDPPSDSFDVLFAGNVSLQKGVPYLLEGFARFKHPGKRLRIAGAVLPEMRSLLPRFSLDRVEFLGRLPQSELARRMSESHVMALPSIQDGFGMVMAQAMACGVPVIASEHTGGPDLFTDGVEGFIIPIRSPEAICDRLTQLADDSGMRQRMSEAALAHVRGLGGWSSYGSKYEKFLHGLASSASS